MGNKAFDDLIKACIGTINNTVSVLEKHVVSYMNRAQAGKQQAAVNLTTTQADMRKEKEMIEELKKFFATMKKESTTASLAMPSGHPLITGLVPSYDYTLDVC